MVRQHDSSIAGPQKKKKRKQKWDKKQKETQAFSAEDVN